MSYVDAYFDRDADIIRVVERNEGKRLYTEYPVKYTFYYDDIKGKHKSIYGDSISRIVSKSTKDFRKELAINNKRKLFESDINPIFQCLSENYLNQDAPKLNVCFFDIETDYDPERGFADPSDPFMPITAITVHLQWLDALITLAVPPKTLTMDQAKDQVKEWGEECVLFEKEGGSVSEESGKNASVLLGSLSIHQGRDCLIDSSSIASSVESSRARSCLHVAMV